MGRAVGAANDILSNYQHVISDLRLIPASGGVFHVEVDGETLFDKKAKHRHAFPNEVLELFIEHMGPDVARYGT